MAEWAERGPRSESLWVPGASLGGPSKFWAPGGIYACIQIFITFACRLWIIWVFKNEEHVTFLKASTTRWDLWAPSTFQGAPPSAPRWIIELPGGPQPSLETTRKLLGAVGGAPGVRLGELTEPKGSIQTCIKNVAFSVVLRVPHWRRRRKDVPSGIPCGSLSPPWNVLNTFWSLVPSMLAYLYSIISAHRPWVIWGLKTIVNIKFFNNIRWDLCVPSALQGDPWSAPRGRVRQLLGGHQWSKETTQTLPGPTGGAPGAALGS